MWRRCGRGGRREGQARAAAALGVAGPRPRAAGPEHLWHRSRLGSSGMAPGWPAARRVPLGSPDPAPGSLTRSESLQGWGASDQGRAGGGCWPSDPRGGGRGAWRHWPAGARAGGSRGRGNLWRRNSGAGAWPDPQLL